jgi:proton-coupled amino acid transporter
MSILKCVVGAGSFILPSAVKDAGLVLGFVSLLLLGLASAYTINQLAEAGRIVAKANAHRRVPTYVDVGHAIVGKWSRPVTFFGVVATLIGVCAVYLDFIGQLLSDVIDNKLSVKVVQAILLGPLVLLSWLRNFKWLAWTSIVGDVAVVCGVIVVLAYGFHTNSIASPTSLPAAKLSTFSKFFGQSVFLFAIHTVILPLSQAMRDPRGFPRVVNVSFFWIVVINALFGKMLLWFAALVRCFFMLCLLLLSCVQVRSGT